MKVLSKTFNKAILRMMPEWASETGEGKLVAGIMSQAWADLPKHPAKEYFRNRDGMLEKHCTLVGLDWQQISKIAKNHVENLKNLD